MSFKKNWYPVIVSKKLKKNNLIKFSLFGEPFVLYRDASGHPVCVEDRCPHRGTPLSLGRMQKGELECCYHGWRFGKNGCCSHIPTLAAGKSIPVSANANTRICVEKYGVLWVWREKTISFKEFPDFLFLPSPYLYRLSSWDVPVSQDLFLENLFDLSHLPFVHHNTLSRRSRAMPITFELLEDIGTEFSAKAHYQSVNKRSMDEVYKFISPGLAQYEFSHINKDRKFITQFYCVPMEKQKTRIFNYTFMMMPKMLFALFNNPLTLALGKPIAKLITNQDVKVLQGQYANRTMGVNLQNQPVQSDLLVLKYRQWIQAQSIEKEWFSGYEGNTCDMHTECHS